MFISFVPGTIFPMGCMVPGFLNYFIMGLLDGIVKGVTGLFKSVPILGNIVSEVQDEYDAERNFEKQEDLTYDIMAKQNQYNIDAFNRENAYNTPLAQRQRAVQAGINPNWSDGNAVAASQTSTTQASGTPDISSILNSLAQQRQVKSTESLNKTQEDLNTSTANAQDTQAAKTKQEEATEFYHTKEAKANAEKAEAEANRAPEVVQSTIDNLNASTSKYNQEIENLKSQKEYQELVNDNYVDYITAEIDKLIAAGDYDKARTKSENELRPYIKREYNAKCADLYASALQRKAEVAQGWAQIQINRDTLTEQQRVNTFNMRLESDKFEIQKDLSKMQKELWHNQALETNMRARKTLWDYAEQRIITYMQAYFAKRGMWNINYQLCLSSLSKMHAEIDKLRSENVNLDKQNENYLYEHVVLPTVGKVLGVVPFSSSGSE